MQNAQISQDEFEAWQKGFVTQAVISAMLSHASELKINLLRSVWETSDQDQLETIHKNKETVKARISVIQDITEMSYEDFASYFQKG